MTREELAELVSTVWRFGLTSRSADDLVNKLWPVLEQVYEEGVLSGYDHTNMPECNPYREGYRFEDWHR